MPIVILSEMAMYINVKIGDLRIRVESRREVLDKSLRVKSLKRMTDWNSFLFSC